MKNVSAVRFLLPTAVAGAALLGSACVAAASVSAGTQPRPRKPFAIVLDHSSTPPSLTSADPELVDKH
jgi:hypothetical protein